MKHSLETLTNMITLNGDVVRESNRNANADPMWLCVCAKVQEYGVLEKVHIHSTPKSIEHKWEAA